jgi:localization factor PodJL
VSAAAPWSVKGIEPRAREIAKDLARRSGMTLGEWLNTMIMEDGDDEEGVVPLSRRPHAADSYERRSRSRRVDDAYGTGEEPWQRLSASIDAIAGRLEAAERRSTVAIQGVDQAVSGLVRRLDGQDEAGRSYGRRIDDIAEELREGHRRLRKFEQEVGPKTTETFGKVETTLGALAGRLYDIEERQRGSVNELRQRMDAVEKIAGPGAGADLLAQVGQRLDQAQGRTTEALRGLERSFADLDQRLRAAEARVEPESVREAARFEKLAETLSRQVEANRAEMMRRMDTAETEGRMDRIERAVLAIGDQVKASEERSARAVEAMGREVLRIAQNLNGRVGQIEAEGPARLEQLGETLTRKVETDMGRFAQGLEQRLVAADDRHALALEKLGGEITRISDRLSERIAQSERRSQQALEDIGRRLVDSSSRIEQHYDRASGELAERMRLSEERTAALIAEARQNIGRRAEPAPAADPDLAQPDWRAAAFPDAAFPDSPFVQPSFEDPVFAEQQAWSADLAPPQPELEPILPTFAARSVAAETAPEPAVRVSTPFGSRPAESPAAYVGEPARPEPAAFQPGFGGADVSDALEATADLSHDDYAAETDFVDPRALRAAAAAGRASSTRQTIDAARAAMNAAAEEPAPRAGFGLKRGGKSRLQERLDKQAAKEGGTVRKALGATGVAVVLTGGAMLAYGQLTGSGASFTSLMSGGAPAIPEATPLAALAVTPAEAVPAGGSEQAATLYEQGIEQLDAGDPAAVETLTQAANLGLTAAQVALVQIYQDGSNGAVADASTARAWAQRAAEGGDPKGMHTYGMYLYEGVGAAPDQAAGMRWLRKAAERGLIDSQYNVAKLYEDGAPGIARDPVEALKWYLIAARAGDEGAEAAVDRLQAKLGSAERQRARAAAEAFQAEPLA